jgi:hypothetical protein
VLRDGNRLMREEPEDQKLRMRNWHTDQTLANEFKAVEGHIASSIENSGKCNQVCSAAPLWFVPYQIAFVPANRSAQEELWVIIIKKRRAGENDVDSVPDNMTIELGASDGDLALEGE